MRFETLRPTTPSEPENKPVQRLDEIRIEDSSPKQFMAFLKKWRAFARKNSVNDYWVHFSNFRSDTTDKKFADSPDHTDPIGLYVYPMKYVLSHPSDIWYGIKAANLFVIEAKPKKAFWFSEVTSMQDIHRLIWNMFKGTWTISDYELNVLRNWFGYTGKGKFAKTLMCAIQFDWTKFSGKITRQNLRNITNRNSGWIRDLQRSGQEQTKLWNEAGYDMLIDTGTGAVNDREPEQAIFLSRGAFKPIEKYALRDPEQAQNSSITTNEPDDDFLRKIASMALAGMDGERLIKGKPLTASQSGWHRWWTNNGWRVSVKMEDVTAVHKYNTLKLGEKPHKEVKNHDNRAIDVEIETPYGQISTNIGTNEKLDTAVKEMWKEYATLKTTRGNAPSPEWKPETQNDYLELEKHRQRVYLWNKIRKEHRMEPIDSETVLRMFNNGQGPLGWYYRPKANQLRSERGLPPWSEDEWDRYRDGKIDLYAVSAGGPSAASKARLDAVLKARQNATDPAGLKGRLPGDQAGEKAITRRSFHKVDPFNPQFGPRSHAAVNAFRISKGMPVLTPQQYAAYQQNPAGWRLNSYFPEPLKSY